MDFNEKIFFIGAGKMAAAIASGLLKNGISRNLINACDISEDAAKRFTAACGITCFSPQIPGEELKSARAIIIAVKPQHAAKALKDAKAYLAGKLLISIAAGIKIKKIKDLCPESRVARVMPNTPALIGEGVSAYSSCAEVDDDDTAITEFILNSCGKVCRVEEKLMDAVTGLSGSGPAYVFDFIQALADGGVRMGIPRATAMTLAAQTVAGAAALVLQSGEHPAVLRDQVVSPGGTTAAGLAALENGAFKGLVAEAVIAAAERSTELGEK